LGEEKMKFKIICFLFCLSFVVQIASVGDSVSAIKGYHGTGLYMIRIAVTASPKASQKLKEEVRIHKKDLDSILIIQYGSFDVRTFFKHVKEEIKRIIEMPVNIDKTAWSKQYDSLNLSLHDLLSRSLRDLRITGEKRVPIVVL
jgi:hypothetical protein